MPTGYTEDIYRGKEVTAKDFVLKCARAFGATITMKEEPLDKEIPVFEPSAYDLEKLEQAKEKLNEFKTMNLEEAQKRIDRLYVSQIKENAKVIKERNELKERYLKVLKEVEAWEVPSSEHVKLKEYAIDQLKKSIEFDCDTSYFERPVRKDTAVDYINHMIGYYERQIARHENRHEEEVKRINERNMWISQLKDSLK